MMKNKSSLLFPNRCVLCREILSTDDFLCPACREETETYEKITKHSAGENIADAVHCFVYRGKIRQAILRYKFRHAKSYHLYFGAEMAKRLQAEDVLDWKPDVITYVPIGPWRMWQRGYNQSELLAGEISKVIGVPVEKLLKKRWFVKRQSTLSKVERKTKIKGKFQGFSREKMAGKRILLVDDVFTTGSTVCECARILKIFGALEVYCITLAKTMK